jgi:hypothetical protein
MSDDSKTFVQFLKNLVVEEAEDSMPLERLLAANRTVQAKKLRTMADSATTVGEMANELADNLGSEKAVLATLLDKAKARRQTLGSQDAAAKDKEYISLCTEIAESRKEVADLESMVNESFADKQQAIDMINEQSDNFARLAREDSTLVRREKMVDLREQQQQMREEILRVFPEDQSDVRQRAASKLDKRENRLESRKSVIDAMWEHQSAGKPQEAAPDAQGVMAEIEKSL